MEEWEFYKEQYYKEIERKSEISNSLTTPIGLISALLAVIFYLITAFSYSINRTCLILFLIIVVIVLFFLSISTYHLIKAFSDFHNGYKYAYLIDTDELDKYCQELKEYYNSSNLPDNSTIDFNDYLLKEFIKATGINQKNNKSKIYHRFLCHKHMINGFMALCLLMVPFGINYGINKSNQVPPQSVVIDSTLNLNLNSKQNQVFFDSIILKTINMVDNKNDQREKPEPPPTQIIQEGENPIKPQTNNSTKKR